MSDITITKSDALGIIKILYALELICDREDYPLPDHMQADMARIHGMLERKVVEDKQ